MYHKLLFQINILVSDHNYNLLSSCNLLLMHLFINCGEIVISGYEMLCYGFHYAVADVSLLPPPCFARDSRNIFLNSKSVTFRKISDSILDANQSTVFFNDRRDRFITFEK